MARSARPLLDNQPQIIRQEILDEILANLGFIDPDEFAIQRIRANVGMEGVRSHGIAGAVERCRKGTGKTTRRLLWAMQLLLADSDAYVQMHVEVKNNDEAGHARLWTKQMTEDLRLMCETARFPELKIRILLGVVNVAVSRKFKGDRVVLPVFDDTDEIHLSPWKLHIGFWNSFGYQPKLSSFCTISTP